MNWDKNYYNILKSLLKFVYQISYESTTTHFKTFHWHPVMSLNTIIVSDFVDLLIVWSLYI